MLNNGLDQTRAKEKPRVGGASRSLQTPGSAWSVWIKVALSLTGDVQAAGDNDGRVDLPEPKALPA